MTDKDKDMEQDKRLDYIDAELIDIKSVTHKSEVHQWGGIVAEHRAIEQTVNALKENSDFIAKFARSFLGLLKIIGTMLGLVLSTYAVIKIFF